ncbi:hypothetical protein BJP36_38730 [Moorena producens JHB]|uniref:Uncharacterized protein n=1 Tax=Moorena producens (strain JHB) TaxID=1454205 RepID=A0A9Q9UWM8_MOOP1|nr:hypothetical protein [Moorena producens]WAN70008.1 hypothetical protein BJP36_38730 [Moorena producens JHB]
MRIFDGILPTPYSLLPNFYPYRLFYFWVIISKYEAQKIINLVGRYCGESNAANTKHFLMQ